jgi:hypothetical protein
MSRRLAIALVHHPVLDKQGGIVTSALTNMDVHDLARSGTTYGCTDFFVVHPIEAQRTMVERILHHWNEGSSSKRIPDRKEALAIVRAVPRLEDAVVALAGSGPKPVVWATAAQEKTSVVSFADARRGLALDGPPVLLVFGTGWGLPPAITATADAVLEPIRGVGAWNHLSVRAACAIALDRLRGAA